MRSCEEYEALISAFLDGELSGNERVELAEHLTACPRCQQYFDDLVAMHDALAQEEAPVPEGFTENVMAQVRETPQSGKIIRFPHWRRWTAMAACCAFAALGLWSAWRWSSQPKAVTQTAMAGIAMSRSAAPEDAEAGDGLMLMMDEIEAEAEVPAPAAAQDAEDGGTADTFRQEAAAEKTAPEYMEDACMEEAEAPAPALASAVPVLCGTVAAGGSAAQEWVETALGLEWEIGRTYPLTEEEYAGLLEVLSAAGEEFRLEAGEVRQLLAVEQGP